MPAQCTTEVDSQVFQAHGPEVVSSLWDFGLDKGCSHSHQPCQGQLDFNILPLPDPEHTITAITARWDFQLAMDISGLDLHETTDVIFRLGYVQPFSEIQAFNAVAMRLF